MLLEQQIDEIILMSLKEDISYGDITTDSLITDVCNVEGNLIAKESGILAGINIFNRVFNLLDDTITIVNYKKDGDKLDKGDIIATINGKAKGILKGERTALNLLQRMSGIATSTNQLVMAIEGTNAKVVDTRKTIPGLRILDKYAVKIGGGYNHRFNLSDAVMIKDNHIKAVGTILKAVNMAKESIPHTMKIEVEVETLEQVKEALRANADIIMLDNMDYNNMSEAVRLIGDNAITEASGNISINTIRQVAETGVDIISCGAITHSVKALDISLKFK